MCSGDAPKVEVAVLEEAGEGRGKREWSALEVRGWAY
jgi:hypothetical protein